MGLCGDGVAAGLREWETRGQGDKGTRRTGERETSRKHRLVPVSPCPPLPLSRLYRWLMYLQSRLGTVSGQLNSLNQTWRDQEHLKFAEEFTQHLKLLSRFVEANERHVPYLLRKAERIEEYMNQR